VVMWRLFGPTIVFVAFIEPQPCYVVVIITVFVNVVDVAVVVVVVEVVAVDDGSMMSWWCDSDFPHDSMFPATYIFRKRSGTVYIVLILRQNNYFASLVVCGAYVPKRLGHWFHSRWLRFGILINYIFQLIITGTQPVKPWLTRWTLLDSVQWT
jgi:hypothetical protein